MHTTRSHEPIQHRYIVEWTPWADVYAAAAKAGMSSTGEPLDFVDPDDFEVAQPFNSLSLAARYASKVVASDTWHCPRIRRQVWVPNDHDDLGNPVSPRPDWVSEATWEVFDDTDVNALTDDKPDWTA
jgi:hypothetical protein